MIPFDSTNPNNSNVEIKQDERLDALLDADKSKRAGLFILQKARGVRFTADTILLANFAARKSFRRALDIGCGCGVISILLADRFREARFDAIDIQPEYADMARRSVALNELANRIRVFECDAANAKTCINGMQYDLITCNPPYFAGGKVLSAETDEARVARESDALSPYGLAKVAARFLTTAGRLCVVLPAFRFLEMCDAAREFGIEPKRVQFVNDGIESPPYLFLMEAMRSAKPGLHFDAPHIVTR